MQHHRKLRIPDSLADACDPERMALVLYDMQVGVVSQLSDGPQVTKRSAGCSRRRAVPASACSSPGT
jgi:biuret amidohydrolase